MKTLRLLALSGALMALTASQVAAAQTAAPPCVRQADLADAVVYAMPSMISALQAKCAASLPANGFLKTQGVQLSASYAARQGSAWPGARRFLLGFAATSVKPADSEMLEIVSSLPAESMRPFVDAMIQQEVSKKIPLKDCRNIERGVSMLAPLPPENMGGLAVFLARITGVKQPAICESS
ncbi:hypothetical protein [Allopontixanthobacter sp.]|uniref:hypothetical protein n=1 Tax=Allopontixanthobacter sp. TaxID=2906452 RepID=UPI002ABA80C7|nr:hypothetical protein [Allopontixanthobacter sp.]MDZ4308920.1 hypothetical protein [Allopontixanthobacter sp.]